VRVFLLDLMHHFYRVFTMFRRFALLTLLLPLPVQAATVNFCWQGSDGYTMTGRMQIPDAHMSRSVVTEADVSRFKIAGYANGHLLGTWDMSQISDDTTWHLRFDPKKMIFLTGGSFAGTHSQGWNANGNVDDCGTGGFGFNSGNFAQDICVNGTYVSASSIDPATPFMATTAPVRPDCGATLPMSKLSIRESGD